MKKDEIKVGETYIAKVTGVRAAVRIEAEHPKGGWTATNVKTNRKVRIKSPQRLQRKADFVKPPAKKNRPIGSSRGGGPLAKAFTVSAKAKTQTSDAKPKAEPTADPPAKSAKKLSCLDAAAKVLEETDQPMTTKAMIEAMADKGYWSSDAATPSQTLYSAIAREIKTKGDASRFVKTVRGNFQLANLAVATTQGA